MTIEGRADLNFECGACLDTGYVRKNIRLGPGRGFGIESTPCKNAECRPKARRTVEAAAPAVSISDLLREEMRLERNRNAS